MAFGANMPRNARVRRTAALCPGMLLVCLLIWPSIIPLKTGVVSQCKTHPHNVRTPNTSSELIPKTDLESRRTYLGEPWQTAFPRGQRLWCWLSDNTGAPTTPWTDPASLAEYGYVYDGQGVGLRRSILDIMVVLDELGIAVAQPALEDILLKHTQETTVQLTNQQLTYWIDNKFVKEKATGGIVFPVCATTMQIQPGLNGVADLSQPTLAEFRNVFDMQAGAIIAMTNFNPEYRIKYNQMRNSWEYPNDEPVVPLSQWSDIVFLSWKKLATAEQMTGLKYVIRHSIINEATRRLMQQALLTDGVIGVPAWPGHKFTMGTQAATGLLGTPNALGVAWLLIQHVEEFGHKTIQDITVWVDEDVPVEDRNNWKLVYPNMLFTIVDCKEPAAGQPEGEAGPA